MTGQFIKRGAIVDIIKSRERTNAIQKRDSLTQHPVSFTVCGCPDPNCGGWYTIILERTVPTTHECKAILQADKLARRKSKAGQA